MKKTNKKLNNKGFSLVELIIVIAIMAILVGVLSPQLMKYIEKSRYSADVQTIDAAYTALKVALAEETAYEVASTAIPAAGETFDNVLKKADSNKYAEEVKSIFGADKTQLKSKAFKSQPINCKYDGVAVTVSITSTFSSGDDDKLKALYPDVYLPESSKPATAGS